MVKKQCFGHRLQEVHEVVAAQHMGQFVGQNGFQIHGRKTSYRSQRQQNHGPDVAHHQRHPHQRRFEQRHWPAQATPGGQHRQPLLPRRSQWPHAVAAEPLHVEQAAQQTQAHGQQAQQPRHHQQRQVPVKVPQARGQPLSRGRCWNRFSHRGGLGGRWRFFSRPRSGVPYRRRAPGGRVPLGCQLVLPGLCRARAGQHALPGSSAEVQSEGDTRQSHHHHQRPGRSHVAHFGALAAQQQQRPSQYGRHQCPLPQRMQQRPTQSPHQSGRNEVLKRGHRRRS